MSRLNWLMVALCLVIASGFAIASDSSVDQNIKDLNSDNPEIRAKAAYDLGCT